MYIMFLVGICKYCHETFFIHCMISCSSSWLLLTSGMSNIRPAGRMRPANGFNAARETFSECAYIKKKIF